MNIFELFGYKGNSRSEVQVELFEGEAGIAGLLAGREAIKSGKSPEEAMDVAREVSRSLTEKEKKK